MLCNIRYVSRVKWSNPGKGVVLSPTLWCSSYWKGRLLVALDFTYLYKIYLSSFYIIFKKKTFLGIMNAFHFYFILKTPFININYCSSSDGDLLCGLVQGSWRIPILIDFCDCLIYHSQGWCSRSLAEFFFSSTKVKGFEIYIYFFNFFFLR